jgi:predicted RNase H-like nuclease
VVDGNAAPEEIASYRPRDLVVDDVLKALDNALHSSSPVPAVFDGKF